MELNKRELLLQAALKMFVENGFENSPTSKIAKNAGVATGTLFNYFETKTKLINELYLEVKNELAAALKKNLSEAVTVRQKIETIWFNCVTWAIERPDGNRFFAMYKTSSYILSSTREEGYKKFSFVLDILKEGIEKEILKDVPVILLNESMFGTIFGSVAFLTAHYEEFSNKEFRDKSFSILWDSLKR